MLCLKISHNIRVALQSDLWIRRVALQSDLWMRRVALQSDLRMRSYISIYRRRWQPLSVHLRSHPAH